MVKCLNVFNSLRTYICIFCLQTLSPQLFHWCWITYLVLYVIINLYAEKVRLSLRRYWACARCHYTKLGNICSYVFYDFRKEFSIFRYLLYSWFGFQLLIKFSWTSLLIGGKELLYPVIVICKILYLVKSLPYYIWTVFEGVSFLFPRATKIKQLYNILLLWRNLQMQQFVLPFLDQPCELVLIRLYKQSGRRSLNIPVVCFQRYKTADSFYELVRKQNCLQIGHAVSSLWPDATHKADLLSKSVIIL